MTRFRVCEVVEGGRRLHEDRVVTEEPLEIRLQAPGLQPRRLAVTMRTPGQDFELAAGWLVHDGITTPDAIGGVRYCTDEELSGQEQFNVVTVSLTAPPLTLPAARAVNSACGVCGADSIHEVHPRPREEAQQRLEVLQKLPDLLRESQPAFDRTGGVHAAGLFEADGSPVVVREDVGRHNAVDKALGSRYLAGAVVPPVLVLSGRMGFELVQKAAVAGVDALVSVGAPSSLAVRLAREAGMVAVGFTRPERCVVYAGEDRLH